ncbi:hypothetical protein MPSEU_000496500 [Mayamaea pseudoterrestris]|nr:hypothetical protein MPSEU_000495400 [Mayamaea pseudoterrestris]GKY95347.1 hypothetical protein MPSEU_000496500 [Mayamaea pseudoterrestris]
MQHEIPSQEFAQLKKDSMSEDVEATGTNEDLPVSSNVDEPPQKNVANDRTENGRPPAEFKIGEVVYAADENDLIYEATIRRKLYGVNYQKKVVAGMVTSVEEANALLAQQELPVWHYFVHYHGWSVKWDRWTSASKIFVHSDASKALAKRLQEEYRKVRDELSGLAKGKRPRKVTAEELLPVWKSSMLKIYRAFELRQNQTEEEQAEAANDGIAIPNVVTAPHIELPVFTNNTNQCKGEDIRDAALHTELAFRKKGLTSLHIYGAFIPLPVTLKRILVDAWENITQCSSVPILPAKVSVKDALNLYIQRKGVELECATVDAELNDANASASAASLHDINANKQQWIDMIDGICQYFDETLPCHLLYAEELAQLHTMCADDETNIESYSEIYGCEHLLRLLTRLPALLLDNAAEQELRPILAKVNDFVRFMHKSDSLWALSYRPLNDAELGEKIKLEKMKDTKRKRDTKSDAMGDFSSEMGGKRQMTVPD